jgi:hypothetical protein
MGSLDAWRIPPVTALFNTGLFLRQLQFQMLAKVPFASRTILSTPSLAPFAYHQPVLMTQRPGYLDGIITSNSCQKVYCLKVHDSWHGGERTTHPTSGL